MASDPAVDIATVIANLKSSTIHSFDEVQIIAASDFDKNDVVWLKRRRVARFQGHQVTVIDLAAHRMATRPDLNGLASL